MNSGGWQRRFGAATLAILLSVGLTACGGGESRTIYPDDDRRDTGQDAYDVGSEGSVFGPSGLDIFADDEPGEGGAAGGTGIGVNAFLWRASLDTVSFMPLSSADPFGGVIITDWYSPPESPNERFKVNIFILGRDLRADGVRARVFRQVNSGQVSAGGSGGWQDAPVGETTGLDLENAILTRARELRIAALN